MQYHGFHNPTASTGVELFTTSTASSIKTKKDCNRLRALLIAKKVAFIEIDLAMNLFRRAGMLERSNGVDILPQLHANGKFIGDLGKVQELEDFGELDELLQCNGKGKSIRINLANAKGSLFDTRPSEASSEEGEAGEGDSDAIRRSAGGLDRVAAPSASLERQQLWPAQDIRADLPSSTSGPDSRASAKQPSGPFAAETSEALLPGAPQGESNPLQDQRLGDPPADSPDAAACSNSHSSSSRSQPAAESMQPDALPEAAPGLPARSASLSASEKSSTGETEALEGLEEAQAPEIRLQETRVGDVAGEPGETEGSHRQQRRWSRSSSVSSCNGMYRGADREAEAVKHQKCQGSRSLFSSDSDEPERRKESRRRALQRDAGDGARTSSDNSVGDVYLELARLRKGRLAQLRRLSTESASGLSDSSEASEDVEELVQEIAGLHLSNSMGKTVVETPEPLPTSQSEFLDWAFADQTDEE